MKKHLIRTLFLCIVTVLCLTQIAYGNENLEYDVDGPNAPAVSQGFDPVQIKSDTQHETNASKVQGSGFTYEIVDGTLTISGSGDMPDSYMENWKYDKYYITKVVIEDGVTSICAGAFYDCFNLEEVQLPKGLKTINSYAFQNTALKTADLPKSITNVDSLAFFNNNEYDNSQLSSITIGGSDTGSNSKYCIENGAIYNADKTRIILCPPGKTGEFTINSKTKTIGENAFLDSRLTKIVFPSNLEKVEDGGFARACLTEVILPSNVTEIGDYIMQDCPVLKKVDFGTGLKTLGHRTCSGCKELTDVKLRNISDMNYLSFAECISLKSISIPKGVNEIKNGSFGECTNLTEVKFNGKVKGIWYQAFLNCKSLKNITLPSSLKEINRLAFWGTGLTTVKIPSNMDYIGEEAFPDGCKLTNLSNANLTKCADGTYQHLGAVHVSSYRDYKKAFEVLSKVNAERKKRGYTALKMDKSLLDTAMLRASETAVYWSHTRPDGSQCFTANSKMFGENIAAGQTSASSVMTSWMNSDGHRANILSSGYTTIGIGVVKVDGIYYWVQCFGNDKGDKATKSNYSNKTVSTKVYVKKKGNEFYKYSFKSDCASSVKKGKTINFKPYVFNTFVTAKVKASDFTYTSSDKKVATVSSKGKIKGLKKGTTTITAKLKNYPDIKLTKKITVK